MLDLLLLHSFHIDITTEYGLIRKLSESGIRITQSRTRTRLGVLKKVQEQLVGAPLDLLPDKFVIKLKGGYKKTIVTQRDLDKTLPMLTTSGGVSTRSKSANK